MDFYDMIKPFSKDNRSRLLAEGNFGVELESQRVTFEGSLALTPHPQVFGDKIRNERITTDFSESQIEMITPAFQSVEDVYESLGAIRLEVENGIGDEMLWPLSMPPRLPDEGLIPIARFSDTKEGREKEAYRNGLSLRYGKKMQMISGIHYNFSFSEAMIDYLYELYGGGSGKDAFVNDMYFALIRNFLRYRWLLIYLFGASPASDITYYSVICKELEEVQKCCPDCCSSIGNHNKYATSLRVSRFGYSNTLRRKHNIYFSDLEEYTSKLRKMTATASSKYKELGLFMDGGQIQLNANILQKESEFYSSIRPKQNTAEGETQLEALEKRGVKYLEVRILDIDPFEKLGISIEQMQFLQVFMLYCLFEKSGNITPGEYKKINTNHHSAALSGREKGLSLHSYKGGKISLISFGERIFEKLKFIAELMDKGAGGGRYLQSVENEHKKLTDISLLPSEKMCRQMKENNESFLGFGLRQAADNSQKFRREEFEYDKRLRRA